MAPLTLEGETLGQKRRHYNKLLKEAIIQGSFLEIQKIDYNEPDIDNMFKIDIASNNKNVEYIIEVLKSEDMLYVSRALKKSVWLITDTVYAHIINPTYLHSQLLPHMTAKAGNKLLLTIRLNLKDEKRVEEFYNYFANNNQLEIAWKWLPKCALSFIESIVEKHIKLIPTNLILRLCEKSFTILEIYARKQGPAIGEVLSKSTFLLNQRLLTDKYLDIVNAQVFYNIPRFSARSTRIIMLRCPDIILDNFEKFVSNIDIPTFTIMLEKENITDFLMKHLKNKNLQRWFTFKTIKLFISRMSIEDQYNFVKHILILLEKSSDALQFWGTEQIDFYNAILHRETQNVSQSSNALIYRWYRFAPFKTAFSDIKRLIVRESNPTERNLMFGTLIASARQDSEDIKAILQYYRDKHINEPFKFKSHFVNIILSRTNTHRFDSETWAILNYLFHSMEVYIESENNVQSCIKHIIVYKVIHDENVPDIVERKFEFNTLNSFQSKLSEEEKHKVFKYLYQYIITKIQMLAVNTEDNFKESKRNIFNVLNLLADWKKELLEHTVVIEKIRELIKIKTDKSWNEDLSDIYNFKKSWRKHMFKESLILYPSHKTFYNALKHGPQLLPVSIENVYHGNPILLSRSLIKIRIFWPNTRSKDLENTFLRQLENVAKHNISVFGLCVLLPQKKLIDMLNKYEPNSTKINWGKTDESLCSIQMYLGRYMQLARPQPPIDILLKYAKGDYLQYAIASVRSIFYNISVNQSSNHIQTLLDTPVSLQKHCLKFTLCKLKTDELLTKCVTVWKTNKNASIRTTVFKIVFNLLIKEQDEIVNRSIWVVLSTFIDELNPDENKNIYVTLGQANKVPLSVRQDFCIKSYRYLKSLPPKSGCDTIMKSIISSTFDIMETLDVDFVAEIVFTSFNKKITEANFEHTSIISAFLLSTKSEVTQRQRHVQIFIPVLMNYLDLLSKTKNTFYLKCNFSYIFGNILGGLKNIVLEKNMITPTKLFNDIYCDLVKHLSYEDNYVWIITWKLAAEYMKVLDQHRLEISQKPDFTTSETYKSISEAIFIKTAPDFGKTCMELLKVEMKKHFSPIYLLISKALLDLFEKFDFTYDVKLAIAKSIQENADIEDEHLLVLYILPKYPPNDRDMEIRSKIFEKLLSHSSATVRVHCKQTLREFEHDEYLYL